MLDRESDWMRFLAVVMNAPRERAQEISFQTEIGLDTVTGYMDQAQFEEASLEGIPIEKRDYAVGFRYRRLGRWMMTDDIKQARKNYDAGESELATGLYKINGEDAWVLFEFPRRVRAKRDPYFAAVVLS